MQQIVSLQAAADALVRLLLSHIFHTCDQSSFLQATADALVPTITCTSSNVVQTVLQGFAQVSAHTSVGGKGLDAFLLQIELGRLPIFCILAPP